MLIRSVVHCISLRFVAHSVTPTADLLFQPLSVCLSKLLNFKVWPPQRSAWVIHMNLVWSIRACVCFVWAPLCLSQNTWCLSDGLDLVLHHFEAHPEQIISTWSVFSISYFCPKWLYRLFPFSFLPTFALALLTLLLSNSASYIFPLSPRHTQTHPCSFFSLSTQLVGQPGGSARRLRSVICSFSPSHFHFNPLFTAGTKALRMQMSKSWLFLKRTFRQEMGRRRGGGGGGGSVRERVREGHRR